MSFRQLSEKPSHSLPKTREDLIQEGWKKVDIEEAIKYFGFPLLCVSIDSSLRHACILLGEKDGKII